MKPLTLRNRIEDTCLEILTDIYYSNNRYHINMHILYRGCVLKNISINNFESLMEAMSLVENKILFSWMEPVASETTYIRKQKVYFGEQLLLTSCCVDHKISINVCNGNSFEFIADDIYGI